MRVMSGLVASAALLFLHATGVSANRAINEIPRTAKDWEKRDYSFNYGVNSGYNGAPAYGHHETRDGGTTSGSYYVHLPDGLKQKVEYTVDEKGGFKAQVSYESARIHEGSSSDAVARLPRQIHGLDSNLQPAVVRGDKSRDPEPFFRPKPKESTNAFTEDMPSYSQDSNRVDNPMGFHASGPDEDVLNFITSKDPLFGAKVFPPNHHHTKFYPSEGSDNTYSPNSLSPLSHISPMSHLGQPPPIPRRTTHPPSSPVRPQQYTPSPPRSPAHHPQESGGRIPPKVNTILGPSSTAPWPQWPRKTVTSDFSEAAMKPNNDDINRRPKLANRHQLHHPKASEGFVSSALQPLSRSPTPRLPPSPISVATDFTEAAVNPSMDDAPRRPQRNLFYRPPPPIGPSGMGISHQSPEDNERGRGGHGKRGPGRLFRPRTKPKQHHLHSLRGRLFNMPRMNHRSSDDNDDDEKRDDKGESPEEIDGFSNLDLGWQTWHPRKKQIAVK